MKRETLVVVSTGERSEAFQQAHPFGTPAENAVAEELAKKLAVAREADAQAASGENAERIATRIRRGLGMTIRGELLRPLARIAKAAEDEEPEVARLVRVPGVKARIGTFRRAMRTAATLATEKREFFLSHGMPPELPAALTTAVEQYEAAVQQAFAARRAHVGANAELDQLAAEILGLVQQLDGMNLFRFRDDPEKLAAWISARDIPRPARKPVPPEGPPPAVAS